MFPSPQLIELGLLYYIDPQLVITVEEILEVIHYSGLPEI